MNHTIDRSVWGTSTDTFKHHYREYLNALAELDDEPCRAELLKALEWCFDRWDYWRQRFFPATDSPLLFPFFQSERGGSEFGHYSTMGSSGQPSVIHIKRSLLLGSSDVTVWKFSPTKKLVLKGDHPKRQLFVDQVILHELVHQYLHEGAPAAIRHQYETTESGRNHHKGHGALFAAECNRINEVLLPELGFEFIPVRHVKRDRGPLSDRQRPSCAQFGFAELLYAWDTNPKEPLNDEQEEENRLRFEQALAYFDGALALKQEAEKIETDFPAPFDISCADTCHQQLTAYDQANKTDLVMSFHLAVLKQLQENNQLDEILQAIGYSAALPNISPASSRNGNGHLKVVPESGPTFPAGGDSADGLKVGDVVVHPTFGTRVVTHVFGTDGKQSIAITDESGKPKIVPAESVQPSDAASTSNSRQTLKQAYPIDDPVASLKRLEADIEAAGGKSKLCQDQFGLKDGSSLSRHLKDLKAAITQLVAA